MEACYSIAESYTDAPTNAHFQLHNHSDYEILLFLEGDARYIVEDKVYLLEPGDLILVRKHGSLTPEHLEITHKASNGFIFLSNLYFCFHVTPSCAIMVTEGMVDYREIRMDENKIFCFLLCTENHICGRKK